MLEIDCPGISLEVVVLGQFVMERFLNEAAMIGNVEKWKWKCKSRRAFSRGISRWKWFALLSKILQYELSSDGEIQKNRSRESIAYIYIYGAGIHNDNNNNNNNNRNKHLNRKNHFAIKRCR